MKKSAKASVIAALSLVLFTAAFGSSSELADTATTADQAPAAAEPADTQASAEETASDDVAETSVVSAVDVDVFFSDEGAGCGIYVSVDEAAVTDAVDVRELLWLGIVNEDVRSCDFSDVEEVGLITVQALDEYEQPDWSSVIEHGFFGVNNWSQLVEQCFENPLPQGCNETLDAQLTQ